MVLLGTRMAKTNMQGRVALGFRESKGGKCGVVLYEEDQNKHKGEGALRYSENRGCGKCGVVWNAEG